MPSFPCCKSRPEAHPCSATQEISRAKAHTEQATGLYLVVVFVFFMWCNGCNTGVRVIPSCFMGRLYSRCLSNSGGTRNCTTLFKFNYALFPGTYPYTRIPMPRNYCAASNGVRSLRAGDVFPKFEPCTSKFVLRASAQRINSACITHMQLINPKRMLL